MKKVVVSGATGFIGTWLVKEMVQNNIEVTAVVRDRKKIKAEYQGQDNIHIVQADNMDAVELPQEGYDAFYHLAWAGVDAKSKYKLEIQMSNIPLAISAMQMASRCGCKKFIAAGTASEYIMTNRIEEFTGHQMPADYYRAVKISTYYILEVLSKQINMPFIWTIIPSTFGEGGGNNIAIFTIEELLAGRKPLFGPLDQTWDFLYVSEVTKALRLIGENGIPGKTYGIGSGQRLYLRDYIMQIRDIINPNLPLGIGELPVSAQKVESSCAAIDDLVRDTGFKVQVGFEEGIRRTVEYYATRKLQGKS